LYKKWPLLSLSITQRSYRISSLVLPQLPGGRYGEKKSKLLAQAGSFFRCQRLVTSCYDNYINNSVLPELGENCYF
jgi:hypothetical protein